MIAARSSPDFALFRRGHLYKMDANGRSRVPTGGGNINVVITPDGQQIVANTLSGSITVECIDS
jgi:hypothetical protein